MLKDSQSLRVQHTSVAYASKSDIPFFFASHKNIPEPTKPYVRSLGCDSKTGIKTIIYIIIINIMV